VSALLYTTSRTSSSTEMRPVAWQLALTLVDAIRRRLLVVATVLL